MKVISRGDVWKTVEKQFKCNCGSVVQASAAEGVEKHDQRDGSYIVFKDMPCCGREMYVDMKVFKG